MSKYTATEPMTSSEELRSLPISLDTRTAAALMATTDKNVRDLLRAGKLEGYKVGDSWRVLREPLLQKMGITTD